MCFACVQGAFNVGGRLPKVRSNVQLHKGWYDATLPVFVQELQSPVAVLHVDCDLYSSTTTIFKHLQPHIVPGTFVVFDELVGYPGYERHEILALYEFLLANPELDIQVCITDTGGVHGCASGFKLYATVHALRQQTLTGESDKL